MEREEGEEKEERSSSSSSSSSSAKLRASYLPSYASGHIHSSLLLSLGYNYPGGSRDTSPRVRAYRRASCGCVSRQNIAATKQQPDAYICRVI